MHKSPIFRRVIGPMCIALSGLALSGAAWADDQLFDDQLFQASLSGAQEVVFDEEDNFVPGGTDTDATGMIIAKFNNAFSALRVYLRVRDLTGGFTAAHFHCGRPGENGPVVFGLVNPGPLEFDGKSIRGTLTNTDFTGADCEEVVGRPINNIVALGFAMRDGLIYTNVHSDVFPGGEIRGQMVSGNEGGRQGFAPGRR